MLCYLVVRTCRESIFLHLIQCPMFICPNYRCSYWSWYLRSGGDTGRAGQRLLLLPVPFPAAPSVGAWPMVISAHVPFPLLLLLQELCLHHGALLVWVLLWILCSGQREEVIKEIRSYSFSIVILTLCVCLCLLSVVDSVRSILHHTLQHCVHLPPCAGHGDIWPGL